MKKIVSNITLSKVIIGAVFLFLITNNFKSCNKLKVLENHQQVLNDSLLTYRNSNNEQVAIISSYQSQVKDFINFKNNDSLTKSLQKDVRDLKKYLKKQGSVTKIKAVTEFKTQLDTVQVGCEFCQDFNLDDWVTGNIKLSNDSSSLDLLIKNDYTVVIGVENKLFKKKKPFAQVINHNPYTITKNLRTYQVELPKPKRIGIGPGIIYGLNGNIVPGVSIQWNLIRL